MKKIFKAIRDIWNIKTKEQLEQLNVKIDKIADERLKALDALHNTIDTKLEHYFNKVHAHLDFAQRDILIAMLSKIDISLRYRLVTDFPLALDSSDHLFPKGTSADNTRYPRFVRKCESLFANKKLSFLDLGCSGGGMVFEAMLAGHNAFGLEGSDFSYLNQRAEWRLLKDSLATCDIAKPFEILDIQTEAFANFNIISCWEVLEHIAEESLDCLFENVKKHLSDSGYFIASVALFDDFDPVSGANWHVTIKPKDWWIEKLNNTGLEVVDNIFTTYDMARGSGNPAALWKNQTWDASTSPGAGFHIVARKK